MAAVLCVQCKKVFNNEDFPDDFYHTLDTCSECSYWMFKLDPSTLDLWEDERVVVINWRFFTIRSHRRPGKRGCQGRLFKINVFEVGEEDEIIETNNLWPQGVIPKHLRHYFHNNAEFLEGDFECNRDPSNNEF
jgi:hypothetical protein